VRATPKKVTKKVEKLLINLLTNEKRCDIIVGSLSERKEPRKKSRKKLKKLLKNLLTNEERCDIIVGHFRRKARGTDRESLEKS